MPHKHKKDYTAYIYNLLTVSKDEHSDRERIVSLCLENYSTALEYVEKSPEIYEWLLKDSRILARLKSDPVFFACLVLRYMPRIYQQPVLIDPSLNVGIVFSRQIGKSFTVAAKVLHFMLTNRGKVILVITPSFRQSLIFRQKFEEHLQRMYPLLRHHLFKAIRQTYVKARNGSVVYFLPNSPEKIRGYTADMVCLDEFAVFDNAEYLYNQIINPMLSTTGGQIIVSSTPRTKSGLFYKLWSEKLISQHHANWRDGMAHGVLNKERIEYMRENLTEAEWKMEMEAEFYDDSRRYISLQSLYECQDAKCVLYAENRAYAGKHYAGLDLGKLHDYSVFTLVDDIGERLALRVAKIFPLQTPYENILEYTVEKSKLWRIRTLWIDKVSSEYFYERLKSKIINTEGIAFTEKRRLDMAHNLKQLVEQRILALPRDREDILHQLNAVGFDYSSGRLKLYIAEEKGHDDLFWSLALACYAWRSKSGRGDFFLKGGER